MDMGGKFSGAMEVELTSADLPGAFGAMAGAGILVYNTAQKGELTTCFTIRRRDYPRAKVILDKRGDTLKITGKSGLYWTGRSLLKRPFLLLGLAVLLMAVSYLPSRVFFVEVEGNVSVPTRLVLAAAEECGIRFGASRREVRSEKMKNALLEAVPELQWAGVNTYGCVAKISVRERSIQEEAEADLGFGNIVASRDGVITSCTATRGNLLCRVGDAVTQGELLISGFTDCGLCIRSEQAEGEVYGKTRREIQSILPAEYQKRETETSQVKKYSLLIGKKRINLWKDSGICDATCGRMYKEYYMTLPGGFQLPVALVVDTYTTWTCSDGTLEPGDAERLLTEQAEQYLLQQMVAGSIRTGQTLVSAPDGAYRLQGDYVCVELIGRLQREWIGETNEQTG